MAEILKPLAFIGAGTMARAIITGGIRAGVLDPSRVVVADPDAARREAAAALGVNSAADAAEAVGTLRALEATPGDGQIVLAVKPQMLGDVAASLGPVLTDRRVVISILAGTPSVRIRDALGPNAAIVRTMPNTPAGIGRGMSAICLGDGASAGDEHIAEQMLGAVGRVVRIDESLMDAFTAVAGSGPAYVFYLAEAMTTAAVAVGFDSETAARIVEQTIAGSGELLAGSEHNAETLRAQVTSKGGTTAAATGVLDDANVMDAFVRAIVAARDRGRDLAQS